MGIELNIRITSPMDATDREVLSGIAVMTLAIANHEMAKNAFPEAFADDDDATVKVEKPAPCGALDPEDVSVICVNDVGHRGCHKFRPVAALSLVN